MMTVTGRRGRQCGKGRKGAGMESLQCICIEVAFRTSTETRTIHGEFTDLREAATYLRKIADEIEREPCTEYNNTHNLLR
jgi:hypothetical protein